LGLAGDRIHVIPHVAVGPPAIELPDAEDENMVLFFGRIWQYKGLEYLIRAEPLVTAQVPGAKIAIAGTGEPFDRYRRMMTHPDRFLVYNHWISDTLQAELFHRASVVVLPYVEGLSKRRHPLRLQLCKAGHRNAYRQPSGDGRARPHGIPCAPRRREGACRCHDRPAAKQAALPLHG
jgi:hypothetical protein